MDAEVKLPPPPTEMERLEDMRQRLVDAFGAKNASLIEDFIDFKTAQIKLVHLRHERPPPLRFDDD